MRFRERYGGFSGRMRHLRGSPGEAKADWESESGPSITKRVKVVSSFALKLALLSKLPARWASRARDEAPARTRA